MTRKLFWEDPYRTSLGTTVSAVRGDEVRLESTIFFAFSGGQESDAGTIGGIPVAEARKDGLDIVYRLAQEHRLSQGDSVDVLIDWPRRYGLMRHHFAAEMVLQLVYRRMPGIVRIGAHVSAEKARIDFACDQSLSGIDSELEQQANVLVQADRPIVAGFSDEPNQRRYWRVDGFAEMACGGTHPRSTGEVGMVRVKRRNPGKGRERLEISAF
ncbi:Ser-tRNA(Ala) deacylase AlaX (editing enzyme) [Enhydrobacter aerosaccus]|uniref:Ser-tRNA(Ala) deacylase AlaX (Editing enzyme) n=1 Tax=Enhydrobacter aerosaccus TaxID=225324 RepID=A0A1T4TFS5_9HYPH|nr:alanyl-tRNA editing protein [Enhydrobacter aerosaccus]SKA39148.1 Ser-tRNA(Ala) deacylase AlaX (editing enzyme) [Enhydrobacter aerosaccus]